MGYEAKKTEHCGPKRGNGAYWGYKWEARKGIVVQDLVRNQRILTTLLRDLV